MRSDTLSHAAANQMSCDPQVRPEGLDVRLMFGRVRDGVKKATDGRQEPLLYGSLGGTEHYFRPK